MKTKDIRINKELILKYNPCLDGLDNFNMHYTDISIKKLINSKKISYDHKVWLLRRIAPTGLLVLWAIDSSFAAYKNFDNNSNYYGPYHATKAAACAADYAADAAANNAPYSAATAAVYAADAEYYAAFAASYAAHPAHFYENAQNERLQALLYFIENED